MDPVAARWGDAEFTDTLARVSWMASPAVLLHLNERATGDPFVDWISGWAAGYRVGRDLNVLVLGCGEGWLERAISTSPLLRHIDAVDVAAEAVERARAAARDIPKIDYGVVDMNHDRLEAGQYDVVIAHSILHHVENLEHAFSEIERSMKRDAVLIVNEYVGPKRFQFGDDVLELINELLACLPDRLRQGLVERRRYDRKERPTVEQMLATDPSEAVRSDELRELIGGQFEVLDERKIGGTILQHLLYDIVQNFDVHVPRERAMIEILCTFEAALIDAGTIPCDFMNIAARRRDCTVPRSAYVTPPPKRHPRDLYDGDPLGFGRAVATAPGQPSGWLPESTLRLLRSALLSRLEKRRPMVRNSAVRTAIEQLRYRWSSAASPHAWLLSRYLAVADLDNEDDRAILALLEVTGKECRE